MARKRHTPGEIAAKLRQVDVLVAQGRGGVDNSGSSSRRMMSLRIFAEACLRACLSDPFAPRSHLSR